MTQCYSLEGTKPSPQGVSRAAFQMSMNMGTKVVLRWKLVNMI